MHGNVWEWCLDGGRSYDDPIGPDPMGALDAEADRVVRGGCWGDGARNCHSACRYWIGPSLQSRYVGLRLAAGQPPEAESGPAPVAAEPPGAERPLGQAGR